MRGFLRVPACLFVCLFVCLSVADPVLFPYPSTGKSISGVVSVVVVDVLQLCVPIIMVPVSSFLVFVVCLFSV